MAYKASIFISLLAVCNAALQSALHLGQPAAIYASGHSDLERYAPAIYDFAYSVHDSQTGDIKSQQESRRGDVVQGQYSLLDADGLTRIVDYHADDETGFTAHVRRQPGNTQLLSIKPTAAAITSLSQQSPVTPKPSQYLIQKPGQLVVQQPQQLQLSQQQQQQPQLQISPQQQQLQLSQQQLQLQQQQQLFKPSLLLQSRPIAALQSSPVSIHQQSSSFGFPLALALHSSQIAFGHHQTLPLAFSHHPAAPIALGQSYAPLAALQSGSLVSHQGLFAQPATALAYKQPAQTFLASPYAIAHASPIAYQTANPLSHLLAPATLALHR